LKINLLIKQVFFDKEEHDNNDEIFKKIKDWSFEERLSKEFEALGFFISNHPLNQFKDIFDDYKIINFETFKNQNDIKEANIAGTVLKVQEKKTQKGNSYAIVKFSDLNSFFEIFIFSDVFETNRSLLVEGNSLIITLLKNISGEENRFKRLNVKKIISLKQLSNKPIESIEFNFSSLESLREISNLPNKQGQTNIKIILKDGNKNLILKLKEKRNIDRTLLKSLKNKDISTIIN